MLGALTDLALRAGLGRAGPSVAWHRLKGLPRSVFGTALAHFGLGVTLIGIVAATAFSTEAIITMKPGDTREIGGYTVRFDGIAQQTGGVYKADVGHFSVLDGSGRVVSALDSAKRFYFARQTPTTEAGIRTFGFSQLYISLGDKEANGNGRVVRLWWKSWVTLIWGGALIMAAGGLASLSDRRLRIGAPARRRAKRTGQAMPEPAE
jgi:cytochrome c-type biogenesis protein CcmF